MFQRNLESIGLCYTGLRHTRSRFHEENYNCSCIGSLEAGGHEYVLSKYRDIIRNGGVATEILENRPSLWSSLCFVVYFAF